MRLALPAALLTVIVAAGPAAADDVYLVNGKVFEDVTAEVEGERVAIGLPSGGEIGLPLSHVERIERAETSMARFRERARELFTDPRSGGAEWLELAHWARAHGLQRAYRESALEAARRDPKLPGVVAAMREQGYVYDEDAGEWLPRTEAMLRRGLVPYGGGWVTPEERDQRIRAADARARQREQDERLDRLTRLVELQTEIELARGLAEAAEPEPPSYYGDYVPSYPVYFVPGHFFHPPKKPDHHGHGHDRGRDRAHDRPGDHRHQPPATHRGGFEFVEPVDFTDSIPGRLNPGAAPPPGQLRTPPLPRR